MSSKLRNPQLYQRLCAVFGRKGVTPHRVGEKGDFIKQGYEYQGQRRYRMAKSSDDNVGEEFSVSCPFCRDTQQRLYINHLWGTEDKYSGRRILWLMHCYNEECQTDFENRKALARYIFDDDDEALKIDESVVVETVKRDVRLPGVMHDLLTLSRLEPRHHAVQWCYAKGYNLHELSKNYGVGYCVSSTYGGGIAKGRIVVPWYVRSGGKTKLAGWTARRTIEDGSAKWVHSASPTAKVLYGLGEAAKHHTVVVVEGPGDKWAVGPAACAVLGKGLKEAKAQKLAAAMKDDPNRLVVILQDPDGDKRQLTKGKPHHIEQAVTMARKFLKCPVVGIYLPSGTDPGSLDRDYLWNYIGREAKGLGVKALNQKVS